MKREILLFLLLALALLLGMFLTLRFGQGSRHGYGAMPPGQSPSTIWKS